MLPEALLILACTANMGCAPTAAQYAKYNSDFVLQVQTYERQIPSKVRAALMVLGTQQVGMRLNSKYVIYFGKQITLKGDI